MSDKTIESGWLQRQLEDAKNDVESWPTDKRDASFDGEALGALPGRRTLIDKEDIREQGAAMIAYAIVSRRQAENLSELPPNAMEIWEQMDDSMREPYYAAFDAVAPLLYGHEEEPVAWLIEDSAFPSESHREATTSKHIADVFRLSGGTDVKITPLVRAAHRGHGRTHWDAVTMAAFDWLFGGDTGMSSKCMWRTFMGVREPEHWTKRGAYPHDPDDLGRCIRLLDRFPEWRPRLPEMRRHGPVWSALVDQWDELEALYREEAPTGFAPRCYARMQEIIQAAREGGA